MDLSKTLKHALDRIFALVLLPLALPCVLIACVLIRLESRGNPLVLEERVGARGRAFSMFAFRVRRRPASKTAGSDDAPPARTGMGRMVRIVRMQSLPQLINVLLGEMSFVGPYPAERSELDTYTPRQARRLMFRPGITGWAQLHGVDDMPRHDRIALDCVYCERFSLAFDLGILWRALWRLRPGRRKTRETGSVGDSTTADATRSVDKEPAMSKATADPTAAHGTPANDRKHDGTKATGAAPDVGMPAASAKPLVVVGIGGHARVVLDAIERHGDYRVLGLLADPKTRGDAQHAYGYPILGGVEVLSRPDTPRRAVVALGSGRARESWFSKLEQNDFDIVPIVHPAAHVGRDVALGAGAVVLAGAVINSGVTLGRGVLVRAGSTLDHNCLLEDFAHVAPGAHLAGDVRIGPRSHIGIGACVVPGIQIGADVLVGAGAVVTQSVPPGHTVVGTPGRTMRRPDLPASSRARAEVVDA